MDAEGARLVIASTHDAAATPATWVRTHDERPLAEGWVFARMDACIEGIHIDMEDDGGNPGAIRFNLHKPQGEPYILGVPVGSVNALDWLKPAGPQRATPLRPESDRQRL